MNRVIIALVGGEIDEPDIRFMVAPIEEAFGARVNTAPRIPLPVHAYDRNRNQYLSTAVLGVVVSRASIPHNARVLAITNEDLFVPDLNCVFGQVDASAGVALVSFARLRPEFHGQQPDDALFKKRAVTEAIHAIAHTVGIIDHCSNRDCVMYFSSSLTDTDRKGFEFCRRCKAILGF